MREIPEYDYTIAYFGAIISSGYGEVFPNLRTTRGEYRNWKSIPLDECGAEKRAIIEIDNAKGE